MGLRVVGTSCCNDPQFGAQRVAAHLRDTREENVIVYATIDQHNKHHDIDTALLSSVPLVGQKLSCEESVGHLPNPFTFPFVYTYRFL